jgi:predicted dienelactone hydrolase
MGNFLSELRDRTTFIRPLGIGIAIAFFNVFSNPTPAYSAEQIRFWYPLAGEFTIYVSDLEQFAKEGKLSKRLELYLGQLSPQQQTQFREALSTRYNISHVAMSQFTYSPIGEILVRRLGRVLQITPELNGFSALRSAFILSAQSDEGLTVLNILRRYPVPIVYLDLPRGLQAYAEVSQLIYKKDQVIAAIEKQAIAENKISDFAQNDLRVAGKFKWTKEQFSYLQSDRKVNVLTDLYLPQGLTTAAPLIVISHGLGSNPDTLLYLSQHLASHGFAVAALEHPKTGSRDFAAFLAGIRKAGISKAPQSEEAIQRPRDVKYLLDALEQKVKTDSRLRDRTNRDRINTEQVGLIGHSLGGYTVLTLGGAQINFNQINKECSTPEPDVSSFNVSKVLQCRFSALVTNNITSDISNNIIGNINLGDRRIKAVLALNPLGSALLGKEGIQNIKIPIAIFASGEDLFTPVVPEQFFPFAWLTSANKYLVTFPKGTHFSFLEKSEKGVVVIAENVFGVKPEFTHPYARALSLAFFQTHLNNRPEFATYLNNAYIQAIASPEFPASLTTSFSTAQLIQSLEAAP